MNVTSPLSSVKGASRKNNIAYRRSVCRTEEVQLQPAHRAAVALYLSPDLAVDIGAARRSALSHPLGVDAADSRQREEPDLENPASLDPADLSLGQLCRGLAERRLHHFLLQYSLCRLAQRGGRTLFLLNRGLCLFPHPVSRPDHSVRHRVKHHDAADAGDA